jgi:hypothetical protein
MKHLFTIAAAAAMAIAAQTALADESDVQAAKTMVETEMRPMLELSIVVDPVKAHNAAYPNAPTAEEVIELEQQWYAQKTTTPGDLLREVNDNALSQFLKQLKAISGGRITEILIMGHHGRLVAESDVATDYYQGDEPKYLETYPKGPDAVFVDNVKFDQSANAVQAQASFTLTDPKTGEPIGAATVGLKRGWLSQQR